MGRKLVPPFYLVLCRIRAVRAAILATARAVGAAIRWVSSDWRQPLLGLGLLALAAFAAEELLDRPRGTWLSFWKIVAAFLLLSFLAALWQARTRVVVERFIDHTGAEEKVDPRGLSSLLVADLAYLHGLYRAVDERRAIPTAVQREKPINATIQLEDLSGFLQNAASSEAKISLGPLVLPMGTVLALFGRLVQGPRLVGTLHLNRSVGGETVVLTAQLASGKSFSSWRVEHPLSSPAGNGPASVDATALIRELAFRMFTDLALSGSLRGQATKKFVEALASINDSLRTKQDRKLKLRAAERALIEALAEDEQFAFAYYNLGVVYTDLRDLTADEEEKAAYFAAAERAFLKQIQLMPRQWEGYYALAQTFFDEGRYDEVTALCDRAVTLAPDPLSRAKAHNLKGLAESRMHFPRYAERAIASQRRAVAEAWRALCRAEAFGADSGVARSVAATCLLHLAYRTYDQSGSNRRLARILERRRPARAFRRTARLFREASKLSPESPTPHVELGNIAIAAGRLGLAVAELKSATRIDPVRPLPWALLATADAGMRERAVGRDKVVDSDQWKMLGRYACDKALRHIEFEWTRDSVEPLLQTIAGALARLDGDTESTRVAGMKAFYDSVHGSSLSEDDLDSMFNDCESDGLGWQSGQIAVARARRARARGDNGAAENEFRAAIGRFEQSYSEEIQRRGLRAELARALSAQGRHGDAIAEVKRALALDPLASYEWEALGDVHREVNAHEHARDAWEHAILWDPDSADLHWKLGVCHWNLAGRSTDVQARHRAFREAERYLLKSLDLYREDDLASRAQVNYWLGRVAREVGEYERAIPHFLDALTAVDESEPLVGLLLGEAYIRAKDYSAGQEQLDAAIAAITARLTEDVPPDGTLGDEVGDSGWMLAEILAWAYSWKAFSYTERDVLLDEALVHLATARKHLEALPDDSTISARMNCDATEGWILLKEGNVDAAVETIERALGLSPDAEAYLFLARAFEQKARAARSKRERRLFLERQLTAARHARDIDTSGGFAREAESLIARIERELDVDPAQPQPLLRPVLPELADGPTQP